MSEESKEVQKHEPQADLLAGCGPDWYVPPADHTSGELKLDTGNAKGSIKPGTWLWLGRSWDELNIAVIARHRYRRLFEGDYNPGGTNRIVCMSWDGINAYGQAEQGWKPDSMKSQVCGSIDKVSGRITESCDMGKWKGRKCACPPSWRYILLIEHPEEGTWLPAFYHAHGVMVRIWERMFAKVKGLMSKKNPMQRLAVHAAVKGDDPPDPVFAAPAPMPDSDWAKVYEWIKEGHAADMFKGSLETMKAEAHELAEEKE